MKRGTMSKYDLLDKFEAYETEATFTGGNKITTQVIAMSDLYRVLDEIMLDEVVLKLNNVKKTVEYCTCNRDHVYGFKTGQEYKLERRKNSIGVLNAGKKTWYNFHEKDSPDYFESTDFNLYFTLKW